MTVDLSFVETPQYFERYVLANENLQNQIDDVLQNTCGIISFSFTVIAMSSIMLSMNPFLAIIALVPFLYCLIFRPMINKRQHKYAVEDRQNTREYDYVHRTFYSAEYAKEMRISKMYEVMMQKYHSVMRQTRKLIVQRLPFRVTTYFSEKFANDYVPGYGSYLLAGILAVLGYITLSDFFIATTAVMTLSEALVSAVTLVQNYGNSSLYIEDVRSFLEYEPQIKQNESGEIAVAQNKHIKFDHVFFRYPGAREDCLKNICIEIKPNEKIALVGHNGAGKTTLIKLLLHLYKCDNGKIMLDNMEIDRYNLRSYRDNIGVLFQDFQIFELSAIENVLLKDHITEHDRETAIAALKKSGVYERLCREKYGVDTVLGKQFDDEGTVLSGGEYQKVAIARIFAKDCGIAVFDEPSSALDPLAEQELYKLILEACKDKTVIFISHRLSSAVLADRVFVLEQGEIIEQGNHKELMRANGRYAQMFKRQASNYLEKDGYKNEKIF